MSGRSGARVSPVGVAGESAAAGQALLDRVRSRLVDAGLAPSAAHVAAALRADGVVLGDAALLEVVASLRSELAGAGVLEPLLADPQVTDVLVNAPDEVWVDRGAGLEPTRAKAEQDLAAQHDRRLQGRGRDQAVVAGAAEDARTRMVAERMWRRVARHAQDNTHDGGPCPGSCASQASKVGAEEREAALALAEEHGWLVLSRETVPSASGPQTALRVALGPSRPS